jgi:hypothetical protein
MLFARPPRGIGFGNCPPVIFGGVPLSIFDSYRRFWKQQWRRKNKSNHNTRDAVVRKAVGVEVEAGVAVVDAWEVEAGVMVEEVRVDADVDEAVAEDLVDAETGGEVEVEVVAEEKEEESNTTLT